MGGRSSLHLLPVPVEPRGWRSSALPLGLGQHNWSPTPRTGSSRNDPALLLGFLVGGACWPQSTTSLKVTETQFAGNLGTICQPRRLSLGCALLGASGQSWCGHRPPDGRGLPHVPAGRLWSHAPPQATSPALQHPQPAQAAQPPRLFSPLNAPHPGSSHGRPTVQTGLFAKGSTVVLL